MLSPLSQPSSPRRPGPALVPPRSERHRSPLALWHLLSLDAPTVAALWTVFIARCAGLSLRWTQPAAMFVAVWMVYAADRLLDARLLDAQAPTRAPLGIEARHRFHHRHRSRFLLLIVAASFVLVVLLQHIQTSALHLYALLAALLAAWLLLIHARPLSASDAHGSPGAHPLPHPSHSLPNPSHRLPKELAVGIFFPAAVFIPAVARAPWLRPALLPPALLFAAVCSLNCLFLYAWEHPEHPGHSAQPRQPLPRLHAHWTTRWAIAHLTQLATLIAATAALLAIYAALALAPQPVAPTLHLSRWPALACALSAALLLLLHHQRRRFPAVHLRAAADLVLLTPLLLLPFLRP